MTTDGFTANGFTANGFAANGFAANGTSILEAELKPATIELLCRRAP